MNPLFGWVLAVGALVAGFLGYGWRGLVLALTMIVFWLLLQFNRTVRLMRDAAGRPLGHVPSAIMFQARLVNGMRMMDIIKLTGSLGQRIAEDPETWAWKDAGGDAVHVELRAGRVSGWKLVRA